MAQSSAPDRNLRRPDPAPGDSDWDWEESFSDEGSVYEPEEEDTEDEWDYVSTTLDSSADSNVPLATLVASSQAARNAPGTPAFEWKKKETSLSAVALVVSRGSR